MSDFKVEVVRRPVKPGPETNKFFWNPRLAGIQELTGPIAETIKREFPGVKVVWNPVLECWQAWAQSNTTKIGWKLLFIHWFDDHSYCPPDERLLARLESVDGEKQRMNQLQYFNRIVAERQRDEERAEKQWRQDSKDASDPVWDYSQIKNIGTGSKFSTYLQ